MYNEKTLRISKRTRKAVSPVIATLVLIVIAIVGAVGVGLILSSVSTSVSKQANAGNAGGQAQQTLLIGGSTTVFPVTESAKAAFEQQYHVNIVDAQGGSDAGMQGILSGSLDIGAASSVGAVTNLENAVVSNSITNVVPNPTLIGGSAVVVIENGPSGNGLLQDGSAVPNECQGITRAALDTIFEISGKFGIDAGACAAAGPTWNTLDEAVALPGPSATICAASAQVIALGPQATLSVPACTGAPADTGPIYSAYSRSDNSGTQDQFASFTGLPKQSASGNYPGFTAVGNPGVLAAVQGNSKSIGFVDLGFAEGLPAGSVCPSGTGGTTGNLCGVSMPMVMTKSPGAAPIKASAQSLTSGVAYTEGGAATTTYDGYVPISTSSANVHNAIIAALKSAYFVNPLTGQGSKAYFPDILASGTGLARTFYYVTNGTPTPIEQEWLSFITNFNQEYAFTNNGYFSQYDITSA
jgi:flagellin-like protein